MPSKSLIDRRRLLARALYTAGFLALGGCDNLTRSSWFTDLLGKTEGLTRRAQRALTPRDALAKEYTEADLSVVFPANGNTEPGSELYQKLAANNFGDWQLEIGGLVGRPARYSLMDLHAMPSRTQITRHDCVEGWSAIGKWKGVALRDIVEKAGRQSSAKYVVFHCADLDDEQTPYYESIAIEDAYHPQTILAYEMNNQPLDIPHGAPLRLRIERQLGYKHAKYVMQIELVDTLEGIGMGRGGYWEDQGYEWYAGI